jgi:hypothetical protein
MFTFERGPMKELVGASDTSSTEKGTGEQAWVGISFQTSE